MSWAKAGVGGQLLVGVGEWKKWSIGGLEDGREDNSEEQVINQAEVGGWCLIYVFGKVRGLVLQVRSASGTRQQNTTTRRDDCANCENGKCRYLQVALEAAKSDLVQEVWFGVSMGLVEANGDVMNRKSNAIWTKDATKEGRGRPLCGKRAKKKRGNG